MKRSHVRYCLSKIYKIFITYPRKFYVLSKNETKSMFDINVVIYNGWLFLNHKKDSYGIFVW